MKEDGGSAVAGDSDKVQIAGVIRGMHWAPEEWVIMLSMIKKSR